MAYQQTHALFSENAVGCREELCPILCCVDYMSARDLPDNAPGRHNMRLLYFPWS